MQTPNLPIAAHWVERLKNRKVGGSIPSLPTTSGAPLAYGQREVNDRSATEERRAASDKPISPDTVEDYRSLIAKKIKPALGGKRLHTVNARVLDAFYDDLRQHGNAKAAARARARARAEATARGEDPDQAAAAAQPTASEQRLGGNRVRDVHVILSGALGMAARWGWIPFNPALVVRPAGEGKPRPVPTPEQVHELFGHFRMNRTSRCSCG